MSSDEIRRKTVCLKLAKNGIYLYKNPNDTKGFQPGKVSVTDMPKIYGPSEKSDIGITIGRECGQIDKRQEEESVLQKFIRGFDCGEYCDESPSNERTNQNIMTSFDDSIAFRDPVPKTRKRLKKDGESSGLNSCCRVEFVSSAGLCDTSLGPDIRPLVVDLSRKENVRKEPSTVSKEELRLLNRNFITPKIKVENFSALTDTTSLPLIIRAPETPVSSYSPQSPYPSTKIEIDFTGSSIQSEVYLDSGTNSRTDCGSSCEYVLSQDINVERNTIINTDGILESHQYEEELRHTQPSNISRGGHLSIANHIPPSLPHPTQPWEVIEAARQLYWKRTRTLLQWMRPESASGSHIKSAIDSAWAKLPDWQKQIYIDQVLGKCGGESVGPIVNPQILDMAEDDSWSQTRLPDGGSHRLVPALHQPPKKRKYTKRASARPASPPSMYNFFSSL